MADPWSKFFWSDWEADQGLRLCSLAAQGLWMRMLCVCARHDPKGYLCINGNPLAVDAIARLAGVAETEAETLIAELDRNGVFSRDRQGRIYSRRMVRDVKRSNEGRKHKVSALKQGAEKERENPLPSRGAPRGPSPQKPEARSQKVGSDEPTKARDALCEVIRPDTADAFIAHRKAMRAPLTAKAASLIAEKLRGHADPDAAVLTSIERGWRGVFPENHPVTPFPGGPNAQPALSRRDAAATDALRQQIAVVGATRRAPEPHWD